MKAFVKPRALTDDIELRDIATPQIDTDELLVRVQAIGVGVHDSYFLPQDAAYPYPIGIEGAGVIEKVGNQVTQYRPGERIMFISAMQPKGGAWAEHAVVKASALIVPIPTEMEMTEAAALPVAGNTILRALHSLSGVPEGGSLFIAGGAGAIGTLAIQLGRQRGWRVGASGSSHNHEYMRSLGAEFTVDYHDPNWTDQVRRLLPGGVDGAIAIHPGTTADNLEVVRDGGQIVPISGDRVSSSRVRIENLPHTIDVSGELAQLMADVTKQDLHLEIGQVYAFDEALSALEQVRTRRTRGKLVVQGV